MKVIKQKHPLDLSALYNGGEDQYYFQKINNIPLTEFRSLKHIIKIIGSSGLESLIQSINGILDGVFPIYISFYTQLPLKFCIDENKKLIQVISCGEKNKGRYQIFFEGQFSYELK